MDDVGSRALEGFKITAAHGAVSRALFDLVEKSLYFSPCSWLLGCVQAPAKAAFRALSQKRSGGTGSRSKSVAEASVLCNQSEGARHVLQVSPDPGPAAASG